jgi:hypoxanthine phosphoribosyltransferase
MLRHQARRISECGFHPEVIVGVCRGGWVPARILSDLLSNPNLASVKVEFYTGVDKSLKEPILTQYVSTDVKGKTVLVVDEVSDSGKTLQMVAKHLGAFGAKEVRTATIYCKPHTAFQPDFFEKQTDNWAIFPWDAEECIRTIYERYKSSPAELEARITMLAEAGIPKRIAMKFMRELKEEKPC